MGARGCPASERADFARNNARFKEALERASAGLDRHGEERSDEAIQGTGLNRLTRVRAMAPRRLSSGLPRT